MREINWKRCRFPLFPLLLFVCALLFSSCGGRDRKDLPPEPEEGVLIYAGLNPMDKALEMQIDQFNEEHTDVQIQFRDYSDEGGPQRLLVELAAGRVPDIMELQRIGREDTGDFKDIEAMWFTTPLEADLSGFYWMPYQQMVQKGYLEDLWPYIENDPDLGREGVLEVILRTAEVNGGLYMVFREVSINTLAGSRDMLGDRSGWTLEELEGAFAAMPPDSTVLRFDATQGKVFRTLLGPMLEQYVDWEAGECHFDNDDFRGMVEFLKLFPAEFKTDLKPRELKKKLVWNQIDGLQMLRTVELNTMLSISSCSSYLRGGAVFVGYPTADGSAGRFFVPHGNKLGMSSACRNKEAAWEFMRQTILPEYKTRAGMWHAYTGGTIGVHVNRTEYEDLIALELEETETYRRKYMDISFYSGGPERRVYFPVEEHVEPYEELVNRTTQLYWPNKMLIDVVWDTIGPYLAGDRSMEDTIDLVQNRVGLYVNENR